MGEPDIYFGGLKFVVLGFSLSPPRWASLGLDFLTLACAPRQLAHMSSTNFESLRKLMNRSLDHVVGEAPPTLGGIPIFSKPPWTPSRRSPRNFRRKESPILKTAVSDPHVKGAGLERSARMENVREEEEGGEGVRVGGWEEGEEVDGQLESTPKRECVQEMSICIYSIIYVHTYQGKMCPGVGVTILRSHDRHVM